MLNGPVASRCPGAGRTLRYASGLLEGGGNKVIAKVILKVHIGKKRSANCWEKCWNIYLSPCLSISSFASSSCFIGAKKPQNQK